MILVVDDIDDLTPMTVKFIKGAALDAGYHGEIEAYTYDRALEEGVYGVCMGAMKGVEGVRTLTPKQLFTRGRAYLFLVQAMKRYMAGEREVKLKVQVATIHTLKNVMPQAFRNKLVAFDIETAGNLDTDPFATNRLLSMAFYAGEGDTAWVIPEELCETEAARKFLRDTPMQLVCHNGTFDIPYVNARLSLSLKGTHDTLLEHYVMFNTAQENGLKPLAQRWLYAPDWDSANKKYLKGGAHFENIPRPQLYEYNGLDAYWTMQLHRLFYGILEQQPDLLKFYTYRMDVSRMLAAIQINGVKTDTAKLESMGEKLGEEAAQCKETLCRFAGESFNPGSPQQIKRYFNEFNISGTKSTDKKTGKVRESFDEDALKRILRDYTEHAEFADCILKYRAATKLVSSYIKPLIALTGSDGRIHPHYLPHGTKTGRLSAKNPAIQTIPRSSHIKLGLVAEEGSRIIGCDYSQAELRTVAELSGDENMIAAFQPGAPDFFDNLMVQIYSDEFANLDAYKAWKKDHELEAKDRRALIKGIVYGTNYGRGVAAIAKALGVPTEQAKKVLDRYYATYPKFAQWQRNTREAVGTRKIVTPFGLSFHHDIVTYRNRNKVENEALAFVPQSTANDICLHAALEVHKKAPGYGAMIVGLVHDAIYVECPADTAEACGKMVQHEMEQAARIVFNRVPFAAEAEIGTNWEEV